MAFFVAAAVATLSIQLSGCGNAATSTSTTTTTTTTTEARCPSLMVGVVCSSESGLPIEEVDVGEVEECCDRCKNNSACGAFNFRTDNKVCSLWPDCEHLVGPSRYQQRRIEIPSIAATMPGRLQVQSAFATIEAPPKDSLNFGIRGNVAILYPDAFGSYPLVMYSQGDKAVFNDTAADWTDLNGTIFDSNVPRLLARQGYIVVTPVSVEYPDTDSEDLIVTLQQVKTNGSAIHPALMMADEHIVFLGHMLGAVETLEFVSDTGFKDTHAWRPDALLLSHPVNTVSDPAGFVPACFGLTSLDRAAKMLVESTATAAKSFPGTEGEECFDQFKVTESSRVYARAQDDVGDAQLDNYMVSFTDCHIRGFLDACSRIYGKGPSDLCNVTSSDVGELFKGCRAIYKDPTEHDLTV